MKILDKSTGIVHEIDPTNVKLEFTFDDQNVDPNSDPYVLLEKNPKQNTIQCDNKIKIRKHKVRCVYIKGHGGSHIYQSTEINPSDYINKDGKRTVRRGYFHTPYNFHRG